MKQPAAESNNKNIQERQRAAERLAKGVAANEAAAKKEFPNETWVCSNSIKLQYEQMPPGAEGIIIAKSKLPKNPTEEHDFIKEIKSAIILKKHGSSVTLIPRKKDPVTGKFLSSPDAIIDGTLFEFKEVTGSKSKVWDRFKDSRKQGNNVYIRVANPDLKKRDVLEYFGRMVNHKDYTGSLKGNIIFTFEADDRTYFFKIKDFKKP